MYKKKIYRTIIFIFVILPFILSSCTGGEQQTGNELVLEPTETEIEISDENTDTNNEVVSETEQAGDDIVERSVDLDSWKILLGTSEFLSRACDPEFEGLVLTAEKIQAEQIDGLDAFGEVIGNLLVIGGVKTILEEWGPPKNLAEYKEELQTNIDELVLVIGQWIDGEITLDDLSQTLPENCDDIMSYRDEILAEAEAEGITESQIDTMITDMEMELAETMEEMMEDEGWEQEESSDPAETGFSRSNPYPANGMISIPNWDVDILEVIRGDEAWSAIKAANQYNDPAPDGYEYLLINLRAVCTYEGEETHWLGSSDFGVTGSSHVVHETVFAVPPDPQFDGEVFSGGEISGWAAYLVREEETDLILIADELANWDDDRFRYIAIDEGASVVSPPDISGVKPTDNGTSRKAPADFGEKVITEDWEIQFIDVVRGDEAWVMIEEANQFNDPPLDGMEYVAVQAKVRNISARDNSFVIDTLAFNSTGSENVLYDHPSVVAPSPVLEAKLFPGGEFQGWFVVQVGVHEENIMAVYEPWFEFTDANVRYLSLDN